MSCIYLHSLFPSLYIVHSIYCEHLVILSTSALCPLLLWSSMKAITAVVVLRGMKSRWRLRRQRPMAVASSWRTRWHNTRSRHEMAPVITLTHETVRPTVCQYTHAGVVISKVQPDTDLISQSHAVVHSSGAYGIRNPESGSPILVS